MLKVGMQLPRLALSWAADADQVFSVQWKDPDGNVLDLTGTTVRLVFSGGDTLNATNSVGGFSTWTVASVDSHSAYIGQNVRLEFVIAGTVYLMSQGEAVAA